MTKRICKKLGSPFYLSVYTIDTDLIFMSFLSKSEPVTITRCLEPRRTIDEKLGVLNVMLPIEFSEKHLRDRGFPPSKEPNMEDVVCLRIDGVQPELLVVDADHCLVQRNLIRG